MAEDIERRVKTRVQVLEILERLADTTGPAVTDTTELYYDLGISGDDFFDVIVAVQAAFGTDFSGMNLKRFAPSENEDFNLNILRPVLEAFGRRTYRSLTVGALIDAVERGTWDDGHSAKVRFQPSR